MGKRRLTSLYSGMGVVVALTAVLAFLVASGIAAGAEKRQAIGLVDELLAGCARFGARVVTSSGRFVVVAEDARLRGEGGARLPVSITGEWVLDTKARVFQEDSSSKYKTRSEGHDARNPQQVRYGALTGRRVVVADGDRLVYEEYDGRELRDRQDWVVQKDVIQEALPLATSPKWLGIRGRQRIPTKQDGARIVGHGKVGGVPCIEVSAGRRSAGDPWRRTWWISPERDYMVVRLDEVTDATKEVPRFRMRTEVKEARKFGDGAWLPTVVTWEATEIGADGHIRKRVRSERFQATQITVNRPVKRLQVR